uniref:lactate/malate family dehydrogenase n=1 Tax=Serratia quinivorans TaxID=137545 RepID=UPI0035C6CEA2
MQAGQVVREIVMIDVNREAAEGQALDLIHGASFLADQVIYAAGTEAVVDSDVIVITAGLRRKPDESRLDLVGTASTHVNTVLRLSFIKELAYKNSL